MKKYGNYDQEDVFLYLDAVRESGAINMFGAAIYLEAEFGFSPETAKKALSEWMRTFNERHKGEN